MGLTLAATGASAAAQAAQQPVMDNEAVRRACIPAGQEERPMNTLTRAQQTAMVGCSLREAARQLEAQLPIRADESTVLRAISVQNAQLTYEFEVSVNAAEVTAEQRAAAVQSTRTRVCASQNMLNTMSYGGSYRYIWRDSAGVELARTIIERC